jgi:TDG/mug DNA glycosylase family protein
MKCVGFEPVADAVARILILGTLPSVKSLERREYYANKANSFWRIMGDLTGASPDIVYEDRAGILNARGIALWDVCLSAIRPGSLDSKILSSTIIPNDFDAFLRSHTRVELIAFNGQPAEKIFRRKVAPLPEGGRRIAFEVLPSTSSAHTMTYQEKLSRWRTCLGEYVNLP